MSPGLLRDGVLAPSWTTPIAPPPTARIPDCAEAGEGHPGRAESQDARVELNPFVPNQSIHGSGRWCAAGDPLCVRLEAEMLIFQLGLR
ncbi:hypothetical protein ACNKHS_14295 [Shigella flexneri]